ncbi:MULTISPECIES: ABC transporter ATP-binding protein [Arthrobacter]|uniref:ABC transporter ATP-binding protein n=2 Tax=Arthrobacter TaxID=1663 RepID=A0ABU9KH73_9MICC|nr:ABC transporter ATP-binding protein [Arthrobacter sp. YJM1]MDP5226220.1 ABC transporter ATP-binding protein [Arthrobacter sp. YJM1]
MTHGAVPHSPRAGAGRMMGGPGRVSKADRSQLAQHPVSKRRIAALFSAYTRPLLLVVVLITGSSVVSLFQPFLVRGVIDDALPHGRVQLLVLLVLGMVAVAAVNAVIGVWQTWISTRVGQGVMHDLRTRLFGHLQAQSLGFFTRTHGGEVQSRMTNDINGMQNLVTNTATAVASNVTTAIGTMIAMVALSPWLSLVSLLVLPPSVWVARKVALQRRDITAKQQAKMAELQTYVDEGLSVSGIRLAKTLGSTGRDALRFGEASRDLAELEMHSQLAGRWRMAALQVVFAAIPAVIYLAAGFPVGGAGLSIGTIVAYTALQSGLLRPVMGLMSVGVQWVTAMAFFSRIFEWLDLVPEIKEPENPVAVDPARVRGEVRFEQVSFSYPGSDREVLHDVSVRIPAGTTTAVVGHTGSGKSTLASLLPRLNDTGAGRVTIDGVDVRDFSFDDLAKLVGVVSQETYLVHASVRDNLLIAAPDASDDVLWEALEAAHVAELVRGLPGGLDTMVGARGHRFSGGEQQRLAIARTLLRNPRVLVLDEATSALDNTTEAQVQAALDHLAATRTTLTIAHRLSTVEDADQIVVLDDGQVLERGTAPELRAAGGAFAELSARQLIEDDEAQVR